VEKFCEWYINRLDDYANTPAHGADASHGEKVVSFMR
jgi:glycine betaine catabolism A